MKFEQIGEFNLDITSSDPNTDEMFLYKIFCSVCSRIVSESLANKHHCNMSHARWFTTAIMILRIYVDTESTDENLLIIVKLILKVYAEILFRLKCRPHVQSGLTNLYHMKYVL